MESKKILEIVIDNCEFAKEFKYFLTIHQEGDSDKRRTELSTMTKNPTFSENKFFIELENNQDDNQSLSFFSKKIFFQAFVVLKNNINQNNQNSRNAIVIEDNNDLNSQAKLLGEGNFNMLEFSDKLYNQIQKFEQNVYVSDGYIKHNINLIRKNEKEIHVVGKINISFKLNLQKILNKQNLKSLLNKIINDDYHILPEMDNKIPFSWRIRIFVRSAINMPFNKYGAEKLPSTFIEFAWTQFMQDDSNFTESIQSYCIEANRFPIWNQELVYYPPIMNNNLDGFFNIFIKDSSSISPIKKISFPLMLLKDFQPLNADFEFFVEDQKEKGHLFISLILEEAIDYKYSETLANVMLVSLNISPLPKNSNKCFIAISNDKITEYKSLFQTINTDDQAQLIYYLEEYYRKAALSIFITNSIPLPIQKSQNQYNALANFIFPRSHLEKDLYIYFFIRDLKIISNHSMPNALVGKVDLVHNLLKTSLYSKKNDIVPFKVFWDQNGISYSAVSDSRCLLEFSVRQVLDKTGSVSRLSTPSKEMNNSINNLKEEFLNNKISEFSNNYSSFPEKEKWDFLSKELLMKQDLISRMLKEIDDKSETIKLNGQEIMDLRKEIKILKNENSMLKIKLGTENQIQIESSISKEIENMNSQELKNKILKMAQVYRSERLKNEELEKALEKSKSEIKNSKVLAQQYNDLLKIHQEDSKKVLEMQGNIQKIGLYRETINKQEEVIAKLEKLLQKSVQDSNKHREGLLELEKLKTENLNLQNDLKKILTKNTITRGNAFNEENQMDIEKYRNEISRLEKIIKDMQGKLANNKSELKNNYTNISNSIDDDREIYELEMHYNKALERINILENEIERITKKYGEEISILKLKLAEKEGFIKKKI